MAGILVLLEQLGGKLRAASLPAITCARRLAELTGEPTELLLIGFGLGAAAAEACRYGAAAVLAIDDPALTEPLADRYAAALARVAGERGSSFVVGAASTFTKDVLPRAAAHLDAGMLSDVTAIESVGGTLRYQRPVYAGNALATCELDGPVRVLTCRGTAFGAPEPAGGAPSSITLLAAGPLPDGTRFVSREARDSGRPDLTEARVVVTGGRPLGDTATFLRLIGGLADTLGGAVGATRAAVDSGIAPNDWQVGQTGKIVAPELYLACGVSGAIQHLAGMKDSRVIVAINRDPEAPIFEVATYGLVADLFQAVPELTAALRPGEAG